MTNLKKLIATALLFVSIYAVAQDPHSESGLKKVIVQEVLQVESYTYLNVLEEGAKKWLAVPKMEANLGEVYYVQDGMEMYNFESKELDRKFDTVYFLRYITRDNLVDPELGLKDSKDEGNQVLKKESKLPTLDRIELTLDGFEGGIQIAELFENKSQYAGKKVKIKGEVTKFSSQIMGKNWVHFQDGTEFEGAFDLMITTAENVQVGDVVVFEGLIALDKDFGAGYFYELIMENGKIQQ